MFGRLAAAGTGLSQLFLFEGNAAGGHASFFLHFQLAGFLTAPHGLDEAAVLSLKLLGFFHTGSGKNVLLEVFQCGIVQTLLHCIQQCRNLVC